MSTHQETIGYVERDALEEILGSLPQAGIMPDATQTHYRELLSHLKWATRGPLEQDPGKKQLIPYVIVTRDDEVWVMRRTRAQSEARLHDKLSLGVGGHLDDAEREAEDPVMCGAQREFEEEVHVHGASFDALTWSYVGLLNDDRNEVGKVHLGVVFHVRLTSTQNLSIREQDKLEGSWMRWDAIDAARLETWSQLVAEVMNA
jgi:predicted NUDIX family phosphoesterase